MYVVVLIKEENKNGAYFLLRPRGHPHAEILYHHGLLEFNSKYIVKSEMLKRVQMMKLRGLWSLGSGV